MANYKTIKEILSQTNFNGADAGKLLLISYVNSKTDSNKPTVDSETLSNVVSTLPSKYLQVYSCYETIKESLTQLLPQITAFKQQLYNSYNFINKALGDFTANERAYKNYLNTPLMLDKKTLELIERDSFKDFCLQKITGFNLIIKYIYNLYDIFTAYPEALTDKEQAVFNKYADIPTKIKASINNYIAGEDCKNEAVLEHLVDLFSIVYGTDKDREQVIKFILNECKLNSEFLGIKKIASKRLKNADDYIKIIELYDEYKQAENSFYNRPLNSVLDPELLIKSLPIITLEGNKLTELLTFRDKEYNSKTSTTFIDTFPELYNFAKTELIERLPLLDKPDSELFTTEFSYSQLIEANILDFNIDNSTEYKLQRDYILSKEASTPSQFIIRERARAGIGLAITPPTDNDKELFIKYGDNYTGLNFLPEDLDTEEVRDYQTTGLLGALININAFNNFLEIYSDLLKVDLLPLKVDLESFREDFVIFNTKLYKAYFDVTGDKKTLQNKRAFLQGTFQPIVLENSLPDKQKTEEYKKLLKTIAKTDLEKATSKEYIFPLINNTFMEGLNNE